MTEKTVATVSAKQQAMITASALVRTLAGGTSAMRQAKETYLPREAAETDKAYAARLNRSVLFGATEKTVDDMTGKVFVKPVVLESDVPADLVTFTENIDLAGRHLNVFARDVFHDAMHTGIGYIFVDMPPAVARADGKPATRQDEIDAGIRPYMTYIPLENLIGWKSTTVDGAETLTQIRIKECVTEADGEFHETEIEQIRVVEPGSWRTFRQNDKKQWVEHTNGLTSLKKIALAPVYLNRSGFMCGKPPLQKIAELNIAHWQSSSDQRNILHVARVPILFGAGFATEDKIAVGASQMVRCSDKDAKLTYVEHTGAAIEAGEKDLERLEFQMQTMGLQLLIPQPGGKTATGEIRDDAKENSPLAMMARGLADALEMALGFMAEFSEIKMPEKKDKDAGGSVIVNTDFGVQAGASTDAQMLLDAVNSGQLDKESFWLEWKRRGILSDSFDPAVSKARIAEEAPELDAGAGNGMDLTDKTGDE